MNLLPRQANFAEAEPKAISTLVLKDNSYDYSPESRRLRE
jgi:hypothetical protein